VVNSDTLPRELNKELGDLGLLGMRLEGHGCAGASSTAYGVACRELEYGHSGVRSRVSVQGSRPLGCLLTVSCERLPGRA
jgi:glutaryl-CoA dehydrogenase